MSTPPDVKVRLTADDTGVAAAIKELALQLKNLKKQQDETAGSSLSLSRAFQGLALGAAAYKIAEFGKQMFDATAQIIRASQVTGASAQTLAVFHKAAEDLGISTEAVDKGFVKLSRSILAFQQGSPLVVKAFQQLGISAKDFAGLNTDQKIKLVTDRLGSMAASTNKAALAQQLMGRGGAELIPVLNELAGEGFDKARQAAENLGLILDEKTLASFAAAQSAFKNLKAESEGIVLQFEAGLVPALADIANALVRTTTQDGVSGFQKLGEAAGAVFKGITIVFVGFMDTILRNFAKGAADIENIGRAVRDTFTQGPSAAFRNFKSNESGDYKRINAFLDEKETAIMSELGGKTREQFQGPRKGTPPPEVTAPAARTDAATKAHAAFLQKQLQDELAIWRAYAKQAEQVDKEQYGKGEISLAEYFGRRRAEVTADTRAEIDILKQGLEAAQADAQRLAKEKAAEPDKVKADKLEAQRYQALGKVDELQTKIIETQTAGSTKILALNAEQTTKERENQQKDLEFQKQVDGFLGKKRDAAQEEIELAVQKRTLELQSEGASQQRITAEIGQLRTLMTARANFAAQERTGQTDLKLLGDQRAAIEDKVKNGKLYQAQADQQILDLYRQQLPALQQLAGQLKANAKTEEERTQAADFQKQVDVIGAQTNTVGQQIATIKAGIQSALTGGVEQFFGSLVNGTRSVSQAFKGLAASVIGSLAKMMAQMVAQIAIAKLMKSMLGGFAGGGLVPGAQSSGGMGFAEGGLIRGPGGPKSDSIPVRVSPGEYILNANAVSAFGLHDVEAINRGIKVPSIERLALPKYAEGGLVGHAGVGGDSTINFGIGLDEGLILKHLSSKAAGNVILNHLANNPKAAAKALSRSQ